MKLITAWTNEALEYITESVVVDDGITQQNVYIEGLFMQADIPNRNRRIYPSKILFEEVTRFITEKVNDGRAVGELDHPQGPKINLDRVSHRITELKIEGSNVYGRALILDTPMGNIARGLIKGGVKLGVSSRGMGTVATGKNSVSTIKEDFKLSTVDIVQDPSAPSAFVNGIMEGVEFIWDNGIIKAQQIEGYKTEILKAAKRNLAQVQCAIFEDFLCKLKTAGS
jgi:hypothetical protein